MDKQSLSRFGAIVIVVLILSLMIAFATPFGSFVVSGVKDSLFNFNNFAIDKLKNPDVDVSFGGGGSSNGATTYQFYDIVERGQYRYFYLGCESYEEYKIGSLKNTVYMETGNPDGTVEEGLDLFATFFGYASFAESGMTEEELLAYVGLSEADYNSSEDPFTPAWLVTAIDKTRTEYENIPGQIDNIPVVLMFETFRDCVNMTVAPTLPSSITNMDGAFYGCTSLTKAPNIPDGVTDMHQTFFGCTSLTTASAIPSNVTNMNSTFTLCEALTGEIEINANPTDRGSCFYGTTKPITITGSCSDTTKSKLAETTDNGNVSY